MLSARLRIFEGGMTQPPLPPAAEGGAAHAQADPPPRMAQADPPIPGSLSGTLRELLAGMRAVQAALASGGGSGAPPRGGADSVHEGGGAATGGGLQLGRRLIGRYPMG